MEPTTPKEGDEFPTRQKTNRSKDIDPKYIASLNRQLRIDLGICTHTFKPPTDPTRGYNKFCKRSAYKYNLCEYHYRRVLLQSVDK
jgi:hypothetical protein